jgi:hypothetical protein
LRSWAFADPLFPEEHIEVGRSRACRHRHCLVQVLLIGELLEHEVRQVCPGRETSIYGPFSRLVVGNRWCLEETRRPDDRPVKVAVPHQRFHPLQIRIQRSPNDTDKEWLQDLPEEEPSQARVRIDPARADTDEAPNAVAVHGPHDMGRALGVQGDRFAAVGDTQGREDGILSGNRFLNRQAIKYVSTQHPQTGISERKRLRVAGDRRHRVSLGKCLLRQELSCRAISSKDDKFHGVSLRLLRYQVGRLDHLCCVLDHLLPGHLPVGPTQGGREAAAGGGQGLEP